MRLPLINQFYIPYKIWETRPANDNDQKLRKNAGENPLTWNNPVNTNLIETIDEPYKSVKYLLNKGGRAPLENSIEQSLDNENSLYKKARDMMTKKTPLILSCYQNDYSPTMDMELVDEGITSASNGHLLSDNQVLFHGGGILNTLNIGESLKIDRPLSTSLSPVKALNNGEWRGKYYEEGCASLIILTVKNIQQPAFIFKINGTLKGHEKEVLIHSGATLTVTYKSEINSQYSTHISNPKSLGETLIKKVPAYLIHATIS